MLCDQGPGQKLREKGENTNKICRDRPHTVNVETMTTNEGCNSH